MCAFNIIAQKTIYHFLFGTSWLIWYTLQMEEWANFPTQNLKCRHASQSVLCLDGTCCPRHPAIQLCILWHRCLVSHAKGIKPNKSHAYPLHQLAAILYELIIIVSFHFIRQINLYFVGQVCIDIFLLFPLVTANMWVKFVRYCIWIRVATLDVREPNLGILKSLYSVEGRTILYPGS